MRGWRLLLILGLVLAVAGLWLWRSRSAPPAEPVAVAPGPPPATPTPTPRRPGRPAARPDRDWLDSARALMENDSEGACGPYRLISDVADGRLLALCDRLATPLDATYRSRLGLDPVGEPRGAILLFEDRDDFRRFSIDVAGLAAGYAGFSRSARGIVALRWP